MSGTPASIMRATNSSASIVRELELIVSMKDAAEYCGHNTVELSRNYNIDRAPHKICFCFTFTLSMKACLLLVAQTCQGRSCIPAV